MTIIVRVYCSDLAADAAAVWRHVTTPEGINEELWPLQMTFPNSLAQLTPETVPLGQVLCVSNILLGGIVPIDRHAIRLVELVPGEGFREESTSITWKTWVHDRRIVPLDRGCRVTDTLGFSPRLALLGPIVARVVEATFTRRHRAMRRRFGTIVSADV